MKLTHVYRIRPSTEQAATIALWLELLRRHHNYALGQRLDWLRRSRCQIDRCSLVSEPIGAHVSGGKFPPGTLLDLPGRFPNYNVQSGELRQTKELFPDYKNIYHDVQQQNLKRLESAWGRWLKPDSSESLQGGVSQTSLAGETSHAFTAKKLQHSIGKKGGRPRFKKIGEMRSFTFPRVNCSKAGATIEGGVLKLSRIGSMPVVMHRPLPDGFTPKTCTIIKKADGYYCCISLEDSTVPHPMPLDEVKAVAGVDVGLKDFLTTSTGEVVPIQHNYRRTQSKLARHQRQLARMTKASKNHNKQKEKIARTHQRIQRQREEFHYLTAHILVKLYDLIAVEDLNIKGLARTRLAKSILDAAWGRFLTILGTVAVKRGVRVVKVNPYGTSQDCSGCGQKVPKGLSVRTHECPHCNTVLDRDVNAAANILERALYAVGLTGSACGALVNRQAMNQECSGVALGSLRHTVRLA